MPLEFRVQKEEEEKDEMVVTSEWVAVMWGRH